MADDAQPRGEAVDKNGYSLFRIGLSRSEIPKPRSVRHSVEIPFGKGTECSLTRFPFE